jgi:hypothetical protein
MAPRARRGGETEGLKRRIAEAFVESIFRRAGYRVTPGGPDGQPERPLRVAGEDIAPDFTLHTRAGAVAPGRPRPRRIPVGVLYRASVEELVVRQGGELAAALGARWPALCLVLVTDHPAAGRSCFQVLDLGAARAGAALAAVDLACVPDFDVYLTTAQEYESLVRRIFPLLRLGAGTAPPLG